MSQIHAKKALNVGVITDNDIKIIYFRQLLLILALTILKSIKKINKCASNGKLCVCIMPWQTNRAMCGYEMKSLNKQKLSI